MTKKTKRRSPKKQHQESSSPDNKTPRTYENDSVSSAGGSNVDQVDDAGDTKKLEFSHVVSDLHLLLLQLVLYALQGVPMGLSMSIPMILVSKGEIDWVGLGLFSIVALPFSLKLLWAPLVDCLSIQSFGRRKSWLVPTQLICGSLMIVFGMSWDGGLSYIDEWSGTDELPPNMVNLTALFITFYFLMATQDITVDGWAISMLLPENRGLSSTMNAVGQSIGVYLGKGFFLALRDEATCKAVFPGHYLTPGRGIVTLGSFIACCGVAMVLVTCFLPLKSEDDTDDGDYALFGKGVLERIGKSYKCLCKLLSMRPILLIGALLMLIRVPFAAASNLLDLTVLHIGFSKEAMAYLAPFEVVTTIALPVIMSTITYKHYKGDALRTLYKGYMLKLASLPISSLLVVLMDNHFASHVTPSAFMYVCYLAHSIMSEVVDSLMFVGQMTFFAQVADPAIGGVYMTLLNTIANLGNKWPHSAIFYALKLFDDPGGLTNQFHKMNVALGIGGLLLLPFVKGMISRIKPYNKADWQFFGSFGESLSPNMNLSIIPNEVELKTKGK